MDISWRKCGKNVLAEDADFVVFKKMGGNLEKMRADGLKTHDIIYFSHSVAKTSATFFFFLEKLGSNKKWLEILPVF